MSCVVVIGSSQYRDWTKVSVKRSLKGGASTFNLEVTEATAVPPFTAQRRIKPGDSCTVLLDGILAVTGSVDAVSYDYDDNSHRVSISGRSKTADPVDSSAELKGGGQVKNKKLDEIAKEAMQPFGVTVKAETDTGDPFPNEQVWPGETAFDFVERLARQRGVLVHDDRDGNMVLSRGPAGGAVAELIEGVNIEKAGAQHRMDERHSEYTVKGQRKGDDQVNGERAAHVTASVKDEFVKRHRPLVVLAEDFTDIKDARLRADWEMTHRAGKSVSARVEVVGWTRAAGSLWDAGELYLLDSPMLAINRDMACQDVEWTIDNQSGTMTRMSLVPPEALDPTKTASKPKSGSASAGSTTKPSKSPSAPSGGAPVDDLWTTSQGTGTAV